MNTNNSSMWKQLFLTRVIHVSKTICMVKKCCESCHNSWLPYIAHGLVLNLYVNLLLNLFHFIFFIIVTIINVSVVIVSIIVIIHVTVSILVLLLSWYCHYVSHCYLQINLKFLSFLILMYYYHFSPKFLMVFAPSLKLRYFSGSCTQFWSLCDYTLICPKIPKWIFLIKHFIRRLFTLK